MVISTDIGAPGTSVPQVPATISSTFRYFLGIPHLAKTPAAMASMVYMIAILSMPAKPMIMRRMKIMAKQPMIRFFMFFALIKGLTNASARDAAAPDLV